VAPNVWKAKESCPITCQPSHHFCARPISLCPPSHFCEQSHQLLRSSHHLAGPLPTVPSLLPNAQGAVETSTLSRVEGVFRCPRCQQSIGTQSGIRKHLKRGYCNIADGYSILDVDISSGKGEVEYRAVLPMTMKSTSLQQRRQSCRRPSLLLQNRRL